MIKFEDTIKLQRPNIKFKGLTVDKAITKKAKVTPTKKTHLVINFDGKINCNSI